MHNPRIFVSTPAEDIKKTVLNFLLTGESRMKIVKSYTLDRSISPVPTYKNNEREQAGQRIWSNVFNVIWLYFRWNIPGSKLPLTTLTLILLFICITGSLLNRYPDINCTHTPPTIDCNPFSRRSLSTFSVLVDLLLLRFCIAYLVLLLAGNIVLLLVAGRGGRWPR